MIVLTLGTFDLFHAGHVALLRRCSDLAGSGGRVIVGLNTDAFVERYTGEAPVITYPDREAVIASCRYVDAVLPNDQTAGSALDVIEAVRPDVIAVGWDWRDRDYLGQLGVSKAQLDYIGTGCRVVYLPYTPGAAGSSSAIKARLRAA
jgi:cytidyltransferase-like protein